jgi:transcriptional regulator with XRE-family HTH domain
MPKQSEPLDHERAERAFAANMRALRVVLGLSQTDLASRVSDRGLVLHQTQIAKIEAGDRGVTIGEAVVLAAALGEPLERMVRTPRAPSKTELVELEAELQRRVAATRDAEKARDAARNAAASAELAFRERFGEVFDVVDRLEEIDKAMREEEEADFRVVDLEEADFRRVLEEAGLQPTEASTEPRGEKRTAQKKTTKKRSR